jgi:hypothetical protein
VLVVVVVVVVVVVAVLVVVEVVVVVIVPGSRNHMVGPAWAPRVLSYGFPGMI